MANTELRDQRTNGPCLDARPSAHIAQSSCRNVILPIRCHQGNVPETYDYRLRRFGAGKPLQQLLQHKTGCGEGVTTLERLPQQFDFRNVRNCISTEEQRPNAGIDEQRHVRERSAL